MPPVIAGPRCNRRVTCDLSPSNDRSESAVAANPLNPYNMVGSSKRFTNPATYDFSLAAYATFDGGESWTEAAPLGLLAGWAGTSDPAVAWDNMGNAFLVALPFPPGGGYVTTGIAVYKSPDGGRTWSPPNFIHPGAGDDKQSAVGDNNAASPHFGNVYACWDANDGAQLAFARTTDHGTSWTGYGAQPVGAAIATNSFSPEMAVAPDGTLYVVWTWGSDIYFVKSTDGGNSFNAPALVASGISPLAHPPLPQSGDFPQLPGGAFRVITAGQVCCGIGGHVVVAWADYRENVSRIYFRHSGNGGTTWDGGGSGQPMLTGAVASAGNQHDFHPQLANTPHGDIGCAFYEFGPKGGGQLIDTVLAVSTDNGVTFPNRATVTDAPWDPAVDAPLSHGDPTTTFIGDYFGLCASNLGFFPMWTDTRTGTQEIFAARLAVHPTDVYIRDSSSDTGAIPSPGNHWEAVDLIVRRQPDGNITWANEDLLRDGVTDHYIYGKVSNIGTNIARHVTLAVTVGNYPSLLGLPDTEFRYPQDWYAGDWTSPPVQANHLYLGESTPLDIPAGTSEVILGPIVWPAAQIPDHATWHPCLLAEARCYNDDSAGGINGCDIPADPNPCHYGSHFWGDNNVCQRNLSYAYVPAGEAVHIRFPFLVGSVWSTARYVEVIVDKGHALVDVPMTLRMERVDIKGDAAQHAEELKELVTAQAGGGQASRGGERVQAGLAVERRESARSERQEDQETAHGGHREGSDWKLTHHHAAVGFSTAPGELRGMELSFTTPRTLERGSHHYLRVFQRNNKRIMTGGVILEIVVQ